MKNKQCYKSLEYNSTDSKVWYKHTKGFIVKSWVDPNTNLIVEEKIPYNQPNHFLNFLDNYFKNDLR